MKRPVIGITSDNRSDNHAVLMSGMVYSIAVSRAGGTPILLAQDVACVADYLRLCDGFVLTGGDDFDMSPFGLSTHPKARVMAKTRQTFEMALVKALDEVPDKPALGVCMGMQMMAMMHGGTLHQHVPDVVGEEKGALHAGKKWHEVNCGFEISDSKLIVHQARVSSSSNPQSETCDLKYNTVSSHHQAVNSPGSLEIVGHAPDGIVEAVADPKRRFYLGVQWHPEWGDDGPASHGLYRALVRACSN